MDRAEYQKSYYEKNRDAIAKRKHDYYLEHKMELNKKRLENYHKKRGVSNESVPSKS